MSAVTARLEARSGQRVTALAALSGIALFAIAVRICWLLWHGPSEITWDGAEYARLATNLVSGHGYIGMRGTTQFVFPPLYSLAMIALLPFSGDIERAGLAVSLLSGGLFVLPIYGIAATCYGRKAAYAAAIVAAVLPFTVQLSTVVLSDMLFLTLSAAGLHFLLRVANDWRPADAAACSVAFALAYLTRPEGFLLWALAVGVILVLAGLGRRAGRRLDVVVLLAVVLPFPVLAAPYVTFLTQHAHHVRIEGKSILNLDIGLRMNQGMSYTVAADAIDRNLRQVGPEIAQDYYFEPQGRVKPSFGTVAIFALHNLIRHIREIAHVALSRACGTVVLALLAAFGFFAGAWSKRRVLNQGILVAYGAVVALGLASVFHFWDRYFDGFVPLLIVWAASGLAVLDALVAERLQRSRLAFAPLALAGLFLVAILFSTKARFADDSSSLAERTAGTWLAQNGGAGARTLSISDQAVFYSGGTWWMLPYAPDDATALRYLQNVAPAYLVLDGDDAAERPYVRHWLASGVPDPRAKVIFRSGGPDGPEVAVVRWDTATR